MLAIAYVLRVAAENQKTAVNLYWTRQQYGRASGRGTTE